MEEISKKSTINIRSRIIMESPSETMCIILAYCILKDKFLYNKSKIGLSHINQLNWILYYHYHVLN